MKTTLIQILVSRLGSVLAAIVAGLASLILAKLALLSPEIARLVKVEDLAAVLWALAMAAVNYATNHWLTSGVKDLQQSLNDKGGNVAVDGLLMEETKRELERLSGLSLTDAAKGASVNEGGDGQVT